MKTIVIDVDGVLLNWKSNLPFFMNDIGMAHKLNDLSLIPTDIRASEMFVNASNSEIGKLMGAYTEHASARYMPAYEDALECLTELAKTHKIIALTKFGWSRTAWCNRQFNLNALFPTLIDELISIEFHESKSKYINEIDNVEYFIDDRIDNIRDVEDNCAGVKCILVERDVNQRDALRVAMKRHNLFIPM
ncbi:hypothetical protein MYOV011v1_p0309 [Vibrio phage 6E35.1a]|nr:hypothetical protein MYOV011v1_p0309 [Vibrio phage 6E35.1a]